MLAFEKRRLARPGIVTTASSRSPVSLPPREARMPRSTRTVIGVSSRGIGNAAALARSPAPAGQPAAAPRRRRRRGRRGATRGAAGAADAGAGGGAGGGGGSVGAAGDAGGRGKWKEASRGVGYVLMTNEE